MSPDVAVKTEKALAKITIAPHWAGADGEEGNLFYFVRFRGQFNWLTTRPEGGRN